MPTDLVCFVWHPLLSAHLPRRADERPRLLLGQECVPQAHGAGPHPGLQHPVHDPPASLGGLPHVSKGAHRPEGPLPLLRLDQGPIGRLGQARPRMPVRVQHGRSHHHAHADAVDRAARRAAACVPWPRASARDAHAGCEDRAVGSRAHVAVQLDEGATVRRGDGCGDAEALVTGSPGP